MLHTCIYVYIYIYTHIHSTQICMCIYLYIHTYMHALYVYSLAKKISLTKTSVNIHVLSQVFSLKRLFTVQHANTT